MLTDGNGTLAMDVCPFEKVAAVQPGINFWYSARLNLLDATANHFDAR